MRGTIDSHVAHETVVLCAAFFRTTDSGSRCDDAGRGRIELRLAKRLPRAFNRQLRAFDARPGAHDGRFGRRRRLHGVVGERGFERLFGGGDLGARLRDRLIVLEFGRRAALLRVGDGVARALDRLLALERRRGLAVLRGGDRVVVLHHLRLGREKLRFGAADLGFGAAHARGRQPLGLGERRLGRPVRVELPPEVGRSWPRLAFQLACQSRSEV